MIVNNDLLLTIKQGFGSLPGPWNGYVSIRMSGGFLIINCTFCDTLLMVCTEYIIMLPNYSNHEFKIPKESEDYRECSDFVIRQIESVVQESMDSGNNRILIDTNLKRGLPMENINKIAGPFVEAWAYEVFSDAVEDDENRYDLINVEAGGRLSL